MANIETDAVNEPDLTTILSQVLGISSTGVEICVHMTGAEERATAEIATALGVNRSTVNRQLSQLRKLGLIESRERSLKEGGQVTVPVGGIAWRETVTADRQGWDVIGNGSAYAVDLLHDGQTIRAFRSDPAEVRAEIANKSVAVEAVGERFLLNVTRNGTSLGTAVIPPMNGSTTIGTLAFETADIGGTPSVFARENGTRVLIAQEEQFD